MMSDISSEELMVITILMDAYEEDMKQKYGDVDYSFLYPAEWENNFSSMDKIQILNEAVESNVLVTETQSYLEKCEGVKLGTR